MIVTTSNDVQGYVIKEYKGIVRGIIVRAPTIAQGLLGGLNSIIGGKIASYTQMCEQARSDAYNIMVEHAKEIGANAIIAVRYESAEVVSQSAASEVLCYGTGVVIAKE